MASSPQQTITVLNLLLVVTVWGNRLQFATHVPKVQCFKQRENLLRHRALLCTDLRAYQEQPGGKVRSGDSSSSCTPSIHQPLLLWAVTGRGNELGCPLDAALVAQRERHRHRERGELVPAPGKLKQRRYRCPTTSHFLRAFLDYTCSSRNCTMKPYHNFSTRNEQTSDWFKSVWFWSSWFYYLACSQ